MSDLRTRIAAALWSTGWSVHNHGTEQGDGLSCRERLVGGQLRGECYWKQADAVIRELETHYQLVPKSELYLKLFGLMGKADDEPT